MSVMDRYRLYVLDEAGNPVRLNREDFASDNEYYEAWARGFQSSEHWRVDFTQFTRHRKAITTVSTVFLGLDHNFQGGEPLLYETMIFSAGPLNDYQKRASTLEEARFNHAIGSAVARAATYSRLVKREYNLKKRQARARR